MKSSYFLDKTIVVRHQNVYNHNNKNWGCDFLSWKELINPKNGYIEDKKFDLEVKIKFTDYVEL